MSTERCLSQEEKSISYRRAKDQRLCRWCGLDVKRLSAKRRTYCSDACVHEFLVRSDMNYVRQELYKRDRGICALCGLDCSKWFSAFKKWLYNLPLNNYNESQKSVRNHAIEEYCHLTGVPIIKPWMIHRSTFYDADHIHPVAEGGGQCGMDNFQLICLHCHVAKTVAQRKAKARGEKLSDALPPKPKPVEKKVVMKSVVLSFTSKGKLSLTS